MEITIKNEGEKTYVTLNGRLDTTNADQFQADIQPLMTSPKPDIDIDYLQNMVFSLREYRYTVPSETGRSILII